MCQRYREKVFDYKQEFNKTMVGQSFALVAHVNVCRPNQAAIKHKRDNAALFARSKKNDKQSEMDLLMKEKNSIHNSQKMTNDVLGQAMAAKESLENQKKTFVAANEKLAQLEGTCNADKLSSTNSHV